MNKKAFTLIELLAVTVILAIIALIATPIILGIIKDSKEESNKRSIEGYGGSLKNAIAKEQLFNPNEIISGKYETEDGRILKQTNKKDLKVEYDGNVVCDTIEIFEDGNIYLDNCKVNGNKVKYSYGKNPIPTPKSFAEDSWETIAANINSDKYKVGDRKTIKLTSNDDNDGNADGITTGEYTVRISNISTPEECSQEGYSQTACGFVIEFIDIIAEYKMNSTGTNVGGWKKSAMRTYLNEVIYNTLPGELRNNIISTIVVSGHGKINAGTNFKTNDKLYLLSAKEVWGDNLITDSAYEETRQLDYYKNREVTINNYSGAQKNFAGGTAVWWLRSVNLEHNISFNSVTSIGELSDYSASDANGVAPAFRIFE